MLCLTGLTFSLMARLTNSILPGLVVHVGGIHWWREGDLKPRDPSVADGQNSKIPPSCTKLRAVIGGAQP
jgi:hypothetical protein